MKSELLKQIRSLFSPKQVKLNKRIIYFLFFLTLSAIVWFFNKLDKNYFTQIEIPVRYYNFPKNVIQTADLPQSIKVSIYGRGFTLLRYKILSLSTFYINLSRYLNSTYQGGEIVYVYTDNLINPLDKELSEEVKILTIEPKSIKFEFAKKIVKKLPIVPQIRYSVEQHHLLKSLTISPEYALITGPNNILDTIDTLFTQKYSFTNLSQSKRIQLNLMPIRHCEISPSSIVALFTIDKKTEKRITIAAESLLKNNRFNYNRIIPDKITLICNVAISDYDELNSTSFTVELSCSPTNNQQILYCTPKVIEKPQSVHSIRFEPNYITLIVN